MSVLASAAARAAAPVFATLALAGCFHAPVVVSPSLAPVDATQPMVRYKPIKGEACSPVVLHVIPFGDSSLVSALWDMKRLLGVDGYVEVSVEQKTIFWVVGHTRCTEVTAYPFTYGTEPKEIRVRAAVAPPAPETSPAETASEPPPRRSATAPPRARPAPAAAAEPAPPPPPAAAPVGPTDADCRNACAGFGRLSGSTETIQRIVEGRCVERCGSGDVPYFSCVQGAREVGDVKRCNGLPASGN